MRPIDADAVIDCVDADIAKVKTVIEGKAPYYVGAQMMYIAREVKESIKGYLDKAPTIDYAPKQQWISVKDRLPESTDLYFINAVHRYNKTDGYRSAQVRLYFKDNDEWHGLHDLYEVTHWMPLPEPPKEEA